MVRSSELLPLRAQMAGWLATPGVDIRRELMVVAEKQGIPLD